MERAYEMILLTCWTEMYGGNVYEKEIPSSSLEEFIVITEKVRYGLFRVWLEPISSEVNAELRQ